MTEHPAYGVLREVAPIASVLLEANPSSMTLDGTNSWVLRAPGVADCVVVDPGCEDLDHLGRLAQVAPVALILLTHHHGDHAEGAPWFADQVSAPVRAFDPSLCLGGESVVDGEVLSVAGLDIQVLHTPGHTSDSICLRVEHDDRTHLLTGDTVLGRGTTILSDLGDYLRSLRVLIEQPASTLGLPGHGVELADVAVTAKLYLAHREQRLDQVRAALRRLGEDATARQVVEVAYADVDTALWGLAEISVRAQLDYLRGDG